MKPFKVVAGRPRSKARATTPDVAVTAVESIAAAALRARLRSHDKVAVRVTASTWDLLAGKVGGAKVEGRLWESPMGLTARVLEVEVGAVELDLPAVFAQQRITLRNTPLGSARVVFNARDFGAFLQHPLVTTAARTAVQGRPFLFDRTGVTILPTSLGSGGCVLFSGSLPANGQRYQLSMQPIRGGRAISVAATPVGPAGRWRPAESPYTKAAVAEGLSAVSMGSAGSGDEDPVVSSELSRFFSTLRVNLQGVELVFDLMQICGGRRSGRQMDAASGEAVLELELRATVRSFPPLNVQF